MNSIDSLIRVEKIEMISLLQLNKLNINLGKYSNIGIIFFLLVLETISVRELFQRDCNRYKWIVDKICRLIINMILVRRKLKKILTILLKKF